AVREQHVVPDAMEALRQDVDQEPADELAGGEPPGLEAIRPLDSIVLDLEGDAPLVGGDQPAIGGGDAGGVAGQIGEHGLRSAERLHRIDDPLRSPEWLQQGGERAGIGKRNMFAEEHQLADYYGTVRPVRRIATLGLTVVAACAFSLAIAGQVLKFR